MTDRGIGDDRLRIAAAGRANAGKTTLIRTLTRTSDFGEVDDRANVTQEEHAIAFATLHAVFIDPPGFQNAGVLRGMLAAFRHMANSAKDWAGFKEMAGFGATIVYDERAVEALRHADAIIYVATLEDVPTLAHREEIELTRAQQPCIIGLINKYGVESSKNKQRADNRVELWKQFFDENGVSGVVVFDAHWDKPSKLSQIYTAISALLPSEKQAVFAGGLASFAKQQRDRSESVAVLVARCVEACRQAQSDADSREHQYNETSAISGLQVLMARTIGRELERFVADCRQLYSIQISNLTIHQSEVTLATSRSKNEQEGLANAASAGTVGAWMGALIGAFLGTLIAPGPGTMAGAALGSGVGGVSGASIGSDKPTNTHIVASLSERDLRAVFECCLAIEWAASFQGLGKSAVVGEKLVSELRMRMNAGGETGPHPLQSATIEQIIGMAKLSMERLDDYPPPLL